MNKAEQKEYFLNNMAEHIARRPEKFFVAKLAGHDGENNVWSIKMGDYDFVANLFGIDEVRTVAKRSGKEMVI